MTTPSSTLDSTEHGGPGVVRPSVEDPVVAGAVTLIGGPPGKHARTGERRFWTVSRVLVALTLLTCVFGWTQKAACRVHPWQDEYQYTRMCYSDVFALYFAEGLANNEVPYVDHAVEYPPVIAAVMQVAKDVVDPAAPAARARRFYDVTALILAGFAVISTLTTARLAGRRRRWDAAMVALAPVLVLHLVTNWDLIAVALTGLAMSAWARGRPGRAGVWTGLAIATKLYPGLFLVALLLLCLRAGRLQAWARTTAAAVLTLIAVYVPAWVISSSFADSNGALVKVAPSAWSVLRSGQGLSAALDAMAPHRAGGDNAILRFFTLNQTRSADWDSLWYLLQRFRHGVALDSPPPGGAPSVLNALSALLFLVALGAIAALVLRAARRPRVSQVLFLVLVAFLLANKVFSPQYVLWVLPLAVLARPRWGPLLAWQATEAFLLFTRFYFFVSNDKPGQGISVWWFELAVVIRDLALLGLALLVVRDIRRPALDEVRWDGVDDPAGGVLDGAPDCRPRRIGRHQVAVPTVAG